MTAGTPITVHLALQEIPEATELFRMILDFIFAVLFVQAFVKAAFKLFMIVVEVLSLAIIIFLGAVPACFCFLLATIKRRRESAARRLPVEVLDTFVEMLADCPPALRTVSLVCKRFNSIARRALHEHTEVLSPDEIHRLAKAIQGDGPIETTIPPDVSSLALSISPCSKTEYLLEETVDALHVIFGHFYEVTDTYSIELPPALGRHFDWMYLRPQANLRRLILSGTLGSLHELVDTLPHLRSLETLVVDVSWDLAAPIVPTQLLLRIPTVPVAPKLKELCLSASSLAMMAWMAALQNGPQDLHLLRLRVGGVSLYREWFDRYLGEFLRRYDNSISHLFVWLEEYPPSQELYQDLSTALFAAPNLRELQVFFVGEWNSGQEEIREAIDTVCPPGRIPSTKVWLANDLSLDGAEFWEDPERCNHPTCYLR